MPRIITVIVVAAFATFAAAAELPVESFGHMPVVEQPSVSPNGQLVAAVLNTGDTPAVVVGPFGSTELTRILQLQYADDRIEWIEWANDGQLLISASFSTVIRSNRIRLNRLYVVNRDGSGLQQIFRKSVKGVNNDSYYVDKDRVLSFLPDDPEHILLQLYDPADKATAVFKVNINKNKFEKQFVNKYEVSTWYADDSGHVLLGVGYDEDTVSIWYREPGQEQFELLHESVIFESETFSPVAIADGKAIVISDHELGRQALWQYDIKSGEFENLLFAADDYDIDRAIFDPEQRRVVGAAYYDHFERRHYFAEADARIHQLVRQSFSQFETIVYSRSRDSNRMIIAAQSDDSPTKYFWLDIVAQKAGPWFSQFPELEGQALNPVTPYEFTARDGVRIRGYLTLPARADDRKPPLVVYPHGGPHVRDYQYFDPLLQLFANRGYAVLQVNFRGSAGFGSVFKASGYRQWGGKMQEDVYDAIDWLTAQDIVDADRTCIVGASYGGYVALTAAFQKPEDFACFVSMSGVSDLPAQVLAESDWDTGRLAAYKVIGDITDDAQKHQLNLNSPVRHAREIRRPVLIIHGDRDTQVRVTQSADFVKKATTNDYFGDVNEPLFPLQYIELPFGTHYLDDNKNRLATFKAVDEFLKKYLD